MPEMQAFERLERRVEPAVVADSGEIRVEINVVPAAMAFELLRHGTMRHGARPRPCDRDVYRFTGLNDLARLVEIESRQLRGRASTGRRSRD